VPLIAVGVLCSFGGALLFALAYLGAGPRQAVLEVTRALPAGSVINDGDLQAISVSAATGLRLVPGSERPRVVGKVATVSLVPGSLLAVSQFGSGPAVGSGQAVVGLGLKAAGIPGSLLPGEQVMIIDTGPGTPAPGISRSAGSVLVPQATVFAVPPVSDVANGDPSQPSVVSVVVSAVDAPAVAAAAAANQVSLVLLGGAP